MLSVFIPVCVNATCRSLRALSYIKASARFYCICCFELSLPQRSCFIIYFNSRRRPAAYYWITPSMCTRGLCNVMRITLWARSRFDGRALICISNFKLQFNISLSRRSRGLMRALLYDWQIAHLNIFKPLP